MRLSLIFLLLGVAEAAEWQESLATVPALRTGGASLVSSDALTIEGDRHALITYWESRTTDDVGFYRCVDIADSAFVTVRQSCWKALRPTGRGPDSISLVTSSGDICGQRSMPGGAENVAFCDFSESFVLSTPYFEIAISPFEGGGLVAVREQGRHLIIVDEKLPATVLLEVRAGHLMEQSELSGIMSTSDIAQQSPEGLECELDDLAGRMWAVCRSEDSPTSAVRYLIVADTVYQVGFDTNASATDLSIVRAMALSLRPRPDTP